MNCKHSPLLRVGVLANMATAAIAEMGNLQSLLETIFASPTLVKTPILNDPAKPEAGPTVESAQITADVDDDERPDHSYMDLIIMALSSMPGRQGTLHDIYRHISNQFPFYTKNRKHWKNSVRHNLALHKCFKRLDTETYETLELLPGAKRPKPSPLWSLLWSPAECPERQNTRKRKPKKDSSRKRGKDKSEKAGKSASGKKSKVTQQSDKPAPSQPSTVDPLTRIAMMLPEIGSGEAVPPSSSSTLNQGLIQPPQTPESDYCSLSSDLSPHIPSQSLSAKSTCSSVFEYPSSWGPSPPVPDPVDHRFTPLPLLSVDDICSVLQCDGCPPGSPDSGAGADILDGFGWFDELALAPEHYTPCLADSLLDNSHQGLRLKPEPPAVSFFVPKVPVNRPLTLNTSFLPW